MARQRPLHVPLVPWKSYRRAPPRRVCCRAQAVNSSTLGQLALPYLWSVPPEDACLWERGVRAEDRHWSRHSTQQQAAAAAAGARTHFSRTHFGLYQGVALSQRYLVHLITDSLNHKWYTGVRGHAFYLLDKGCQAVVTTRWSTSTAARLVEVLGRSSARANNSTGDVTSIPETTSGRRRLYVGTVTAVSESGLMYFESLLLATQQDPGTCVTHRGSSRACCWGNNKPRQTEGQTINRYTGVGGGGEGE